MDKDRKDSEQESNETSGRIVGTRIHKTSEEKGEMLEVEIHPNPVLDENQAERGMEQNGNKKLTLL